MKNKYHKQRLIGALIAVVGIGAGALDLLATKTNIILY